LSRYVLISDLTYAIEHESSVSSVLPSDCDHHTADEIRVLSVPNIHAAFGR